MACKALVQEGEARLKISDTLIVVLSDMHSGGSTALFPNRFWQFKHTNHTPTMQQREMWEHFDRCARYAADNRWGKRLITIHNGDSIDGNHHGSIQAVTLNTDEQCEIHKELMGHFLTRAGYNRQQGDKLFYVSGTETHVGEKEEGIAKDLRAEETDEGR